MLKPLLASSLVVAMCWASFFVGQARGGELGMAYAREEAVSYQQAIAERDNALYDAQVQALYWKRTTEKLLSGPATQVFDCLAVDTSN